MKVIFDLDGTLADMSHRLHHIQKDPKDWDSFLRGCVTDSSMDQMIYTARALYRNKHFIEIWTGRSEVVRRESEDWLIRYGIPYHGLRMRTRIDRRPDHKLKEEWLLETPKEFWPDLVFEDRGRVVDMWRSHGIVCCQVAEGKF